MRGRADYHGRVLAAVCAAAGVVSLLGGCSGDGSTLVVSFPVEAVAPGSEAQRTVAGVLPSDQAIWVQRIEWRAPAGLHHSRLDAPPDGAAHFYPIMALPVGQSAGEVRFPDGYAVRLAAQQPLSASYHFVNTTAEPIAGRIETRFHLAPAGTTPIPISMLALFANAIEIPARGEATVEATCPLPGHAIALHSMASHTHRLGIGVDAVVVGGAHDGERIYHTTEWAEAPAQAFAPPLALEAETAIRFTCRYRNTIDAVVRYGAGADDEMCGVLGHYSPGMGPWGAVVAAPGRACEVQVR